jgi:hypothetical protein
MNNLSIIDIGKSLADAELHSYSYLCKENILMIKIEAWDAKIVEFTFFESLNRAQKQFSESLGCNAKRVFVVLLTCANSCRSA